MRTRPGHTPGLAGGGNAVPHRILLFENDHETREIFAESLGDDPKYDLLFARDIDDSLSGISVDGFDAVVIDRDSLPERTRKLVSRLKNQEYQKAVIILHSPSEAGSWGTAELIREGVSDFLEKKPSLYENLAEAIGQSVRRFQITQELAKLEHRTSEWKKSIASDAFKSTVHTISHYINNSLTTIFGRIQLLQRAAGSGEHVQPADLRQEISAIEESSRNIHAVVGVLQEVTDLSYTTYGAGLSMVNIERELQERLREMDLDDSGS